MSEKEVFDVITFKGGKGPNVWWVSLDHLHRKTCTIVGAGIASFAFDSIFRNTLDMLRVNHLSLLELRFGVDILVFVIIIWGSVIYTRMIRREITLENQCELLKKEVSASRDAALEKETENELLLEKLYAQEELVMIDPLTELLNRRGTMKILNQYSARARRTSGEIHVLFIDIDKMKDINGEFGHAMGGDKAITEIARAIQETARREEPGCRYGGDEFLMIIHYEKIDSENVNKTAGIRERLLEIVSNIHALAVPIMNPAQGYKKIKISVTVSAHILNLDNPIEDELNLASTKMLELK